MKLISQITISIKTHTTIFTYLTFKKNIQLIFLTKYHHSK